jgi:hypothetical protein
MLFLPRNAEELRERSHISNNFKVTLIKLCLGKLTQDEKHGKLRLLVEEDMLISKSRNAEQETQHK